MGIKNVGINNMENTDKFLGATHKQSLVIGIMMLLVHCISYAICVTQKISYEKLLVAKKTDGLVEWYFFYPSFLLSIWFFSHFADKYIENKLVKILTVVISFTVTSVFLRALFIYILYQF